MKHRGLAAIVILTILTIGIYSIYLFVSTKNEMNKLGAQIPTAWLIIIPFVSIYWLWKYSEGVELITGKKLSTPLAFVLLWLLNFIGQLIVQSEFNKISVVPVAAAGPTADSSFSGPVTAAAPEAPAAPAGPQVATPEVSEPSAPAPAAPTPAPVTPPTNPEPPQAATPPAATPPQSV